MCLNIFIFIKSFVQVVFFLHGTRSQSRTVMKHKITRTTISNTQIISEKKKYCTVLFWGVIFFIILWNKEMTITNRQYGSNKHECILVVKQRQFGLNFLFFTLIIISNLFSQSYVCTGLSVWLCSFVTILYSLLFQIIVCHTM